MHANEEVGSLAKIYSFFDFRGTELISCENLEEAKQRGDVFKPERGGRSAIFCTTKPVERI